jgi:hypothetical protein
MEADVADSRIASFRRTLDLLMNCPVVPMIACCAFWFLLFEYFSPWNQLLTKIDNAKGLLAAGGDYYDKAGAFSNPSAYEAFLGLFVVLAFIVLKLQIIRVIRSRLAAVLWFITILSIATVSCYLHLEDWSSPHVTILGNWLGTPVMILVVPTLGFSLSLFSSRCNARQLALRSVVELIVTPLWAWGWCLFSLHIGLMHL